jgi:hypothetical protein
LLLKKELLTQIHQALEAKMMPNFHR